MVGPSEPSSAPQTSTIVAVATPPGRGGIGIVRVSGPLSASIGAAVVGHDIEPRQATFADFRDEDDAVIDQGLALYFRGPNSFTGEDVVEFHGHGGPVVLDLLVERVLRLGASMARPGEFSERAFLNDRIDLSQAEAIADLIDSRSRQAARSAVRTLRGQLSGRVHELAEDLMGLRAYVEALIDFPEDEIDERDHEAVLGQARRIESSLNKLLGDTTTGVLLKEGLKVVLVGRPNSGKSSLMNTLAGQDRAIVTPIEGTTRDTLTADIELHGIPVHLVDTAGLRTSDDPIEEEGVRRTLAELATADRVLLLVDAEATDAETVLQAVPDYAEELRCASGLTIVRNKIDLTGEEAGTSPGEGAVVVRLCALNGEGVSDLGEHLVDGLANDQVEEGTFIARRRHLEALERARQHLGQGLECLEREAVELLAEELRLTHQALGEIVGEVTTEDLLGRIFSEFCIGK